MGRRRRISKWTFKKRRKRDELLAQARWQAEQDRIMRAAQKERAFQALLSRRADRLVAHSTVAEQILLDALKATDIHFAFQAPIGFWIVDFLFPYRRMVVELDGGYHDDPEQFRKDIEREEDLRSRGYRIIRFKNAEVEKNVVLVVAKIREAIKPRLVQC